VRAQQLLTTAERTAFDGRPADGSASFESQIALLRAAMAPAGAVEMMRDARRAMELEPPGSPWYALACAMLGTAHLLQGDGDAAVRAFERTAYFGHGRHGSAVVVAHAELAVLAADRDDWVTAAGAARDAVATMKQSRLQESRQCAVAYAVAARVAAHERDRAAALFNVSSALRLAGDPARQVAFPWLCVQTHLVLGQALVELGDLAAAQRMVLQAHRQLVRMPVPGVLRERVQALEATIARRRDPPDAPPVLILTAAEQRVLQLLPTHLTLTEISRQLGISRNTVKTQVAAVYRKVGAPNRTEAVRVARELGLLGA
jgi:LuxR family maltose regulon positive regulatory protein